MLGQLIASLDDPYVAFHLVAALDESSLQERLAVAANATGRPVTEVMASMVRGFVDGASDDHWLQLVSVMGRAEDPTLAAIRAILNAALPSLEELPQG